MFGHGIRLWQFLPLSGLKSPKGFVVVQVTLINEERAEHDVSFPDLRSTFNESSAWVQATSFRAGQNGEFPYFCRDGRCHHCWN
jgi:hypothetical protein